MSGRLPSRLILPELDFSTPEINSDTRKLRKRHRAIAVVTVIFHDGYTEHSIATDSYENGKEAVRRLPDQLKKLKEMVEKGPAQGS